MCNVVLFYIKSCSSTYFEGRPGMFNMRDRAKWDAWKAVEGIMV